MLSKACWLLVNLLRTTTSKDAQISCFDMLFESAWLIKKHYFHLQKFVCVIDQLIKWLIFTLHIKSTDEAIISRKTYKIFTTNEWKEKIKDNVKFTCQITNSRCKSLANKPNKYVYDRGTLMCTLKFEEDQLFRLCLSAG